MSLLLAYDGFVKIVPTALLLAYKDALGKTYSFTFGFCTCAKIKAGINSDFHGTGAIRFSQN